MCGEILYYILILLYRYLCLFQACNHCTEEERIVYFNCILIYIYVYLCVCVCFNVSFFTVLWVGLLSVIVVVAVVIGTFAKVSLTYVDFSVI